MQSNRIDITIGAIAVDINFFLKKQPESTSFFKNLSRQRWEFLNGLKGRVGQDVVRSIPGRSRNNVFLHRAATKKKTIAVRGKNTDMFCIRLCKMNYIYNIANFVLLSVNSGCGDLYVPASTAVTHTKGVRKRRWGWNGANAFLARFTLQELPKRHSIAPP